MRRRGRLPDPSWKSGPTYPEPTSEEHSGMREPVGVDIDGVGVSEAEKLDGTPLLAVRELYRCSLDGCDAEKRRHHIYAVEDVDMAAIQDVVGKEVPTDDSEAAIEWLWERAAITDYDEVPYIGIEVKDDVHVGYVAPSYTKTETEPGPCYGHVEPDWEEY